MATVISPENRDLYDIEREYRLLGDTTAEYLCKQIRELEEDIEVYIEGEENAETTLDEVCAIFEGCFDEIDDLIGNAGYDECKREIQDKILDLIGKTREAAKAERKSTK